MAQFVDLHTHTTASDGTDSPSELVRLAAEAGLTAVAVTDHDTVAGLDEAVRAGEEYGIEVIRGCELSTQSACGELHILGLWLPPDTEPLERTLSLARERRNARNKVIVAKLNELGVPLTYEQVLEEAGGKAVGRPHIARALVRLGSVPDERAAFDRYLRSGAPAYVPKEAFAAHEGVKLLADFGATAALAHPVLVRSPRPELEACIVELRDHGLDVLEAFHADHSQTDEAYVRGLARRLGLGLTGGSDYHGRSKPNVRLGWGRGGLRVGVDVLDALKARRRERGLPA